jgi:DNA polymerase III alpha subunit
MMSRHRHGQNPRGYTPGARSTIEALIQCGAFDSVCGNRRALVETLDACCQLASKAARDRECGQGDLFLGGDDSGAQEKPHDVAPPNVPDYALAEKLKFEKELLGLYISDHPLRQYRGQIEKEGPDLVEDLQEKDERERVREDEEGGRNVELLADKIRLLGAGVTAEAPSGPRAIHIRLDPTKRERIRLLKEALETHQGSAAVYLHVNDGLAVRKVESRRLTVDLSNGLASLVESLVGRQEVWVE